MQSLADNEVAIADDRRHFLLVGRHVNMYRGIDPSENVLEHLKVGSALEAALHGKSVEFDAALYGDDAERHDEAIEEFAPLFGGIDVLVQVQRDPQRSVAIR